MTTTAPPTIKVGDFWYCSWGYDQTNINYFKVIDVSASGKTVTFQEVGSKIESSNGHTDFVVPSEKEDGYWQHGERKTFQRRPVTRYESLSAAWKPGIGRLYPWPGRALGQTNPNFWH